MSYILDALKKAEKERQRAVLPDMLTVQDIVAEKPVKHMHWVYLLAVALLLNAGALVWWLGFSHTTKSTAVQTLKTDDISPLSVDEPVQADPLSIKPSPDPARTVVSGFRPAERNTVPVIENSETETSVKDPHSPKVLQEAQTHSLATKNKIDPSDLATVKPEPSAGAGQILPEPTGGLSEMPDVNKLYNLHELPSAIRQDLPVFSVSALLYSSDPDSRMVRINDRMMHEGQDLAAGIRLEEIARDGVIIRYQKYRFYVAVK